MCYNGSDNIENTGSAPPPYELFVIKFSATANSLAARYGGPVYLVGSSISSDSPRDYDIRVVVSEYDLTRLFGPGSNTHKLEPGGRVIPSAREMAMLVEQLKVSRRLSRYFGRNIDFQIELPEYAAKRADKPRFRLDSIPDDVLATAGMSDL